MIRRANAQDISGLISLLYQVNAVHNGIRPDLFKGGTTKYTPQELAHILQDDSMPVFVYDDGGEILGHAFCQVTEVSGHQLLQDCKTLYIDDICIDKHHRGQHIGQTLYKYVRDYAKQIGCHNITLNVWEGNDSAFHFYHSMGMHVQKTGMEVLL